MSSKNIPESDLIFKRLMEVKNLSNLDEVADFIDMNRSTLGSRKARGSVPYEKIISKLNRNELAQVFKSSKRDIITHDIVKEPSKAYDDHILVDFEHRVDDIVNTIEHGPFSRGLKIRLVESLLRMVGEELDELQKQSDPTQTVDD